MAHSHSTPSHFKGKEAHSHVAETQAQGFLSNLEIHGSDIPGSHFAGLDSVRETSLLLFLFAFLFYPTHFPFFTLFLFAFGLAIWKGGRSALLGWSRLERLHRLIAQEKFEIEHHPAQEREELEALYTAKGFQGKLLQDIVDVLMSDGERLLRVMIEEEMGLTLETQEHPLKQGLYAFFGVLLTCLLTFTPLFFFGSFTFFASSFSLFLLSSAFIAKEEGNQILPHVIWNLGLFALFFGSLKFLTDFFQGNV